MRRGIVGSSTRAPHYSFWKKQWELLTFLWTATNIYQPGSTADKIASGNGLVYLFCTQEIASSAVVSALASTETTLTEKSTFLGGNSIGSTATTSDGKVSTSSVWSKAVGDYTFYAVIFADNAVAEGGKYVVTATTSEIGWDNTTETLVGLGNQKTLTQTAGNWSTVAASVPEPTSGLLMLLGFAGLALRRRRA